MACFNVKERPEDFDPGNGRLYDLFGKIQVRWTTYKKLTNFSSVR